MLRAVLVGVLFKEVMVEYFTEALEQTGIDGIAAVDVVDIRLRNIEAFGQLLHLHPPLLHHCLNLFADCHIRHEAKLSNELHQRILSSRSDTINGVVFL